jgi:hypothetical protein
MSCETKSKLVAGTLGYNSRTGQIVHYGNPEALVTALAKQEGDGNLKALTVKDALYHLRSYAGATKGKDRIALIQFFAESGADGEDALTVLACHWDNIEDLTQKDKDALWQTIASKPSLCFRVITERGYPNNGIPPSEYTPAVWGRLLTSPDYCRKLVEEHEHWGEKWAFTESEREAVYRAVANSDPNSALEALGKYPKSGKRYYRALWQAVSRSPEASYKAITQYYAPKASFMDDAYRTVAYSPPSESSGHLLKMLVEDHPSEITDAQTDILIKGIAILPNARRIYPRWRIPHVLETAASVQASLSELVSGGHVNKKLTQAEIDSLAPYPGLAYDVLSEGGNPHVARPESGTDISALWQSVADGPLAMLNLTQSHKLIPQLQPSKIGMGKLRLAALSHPENIRYCALNQSVGNGALETWELPLLNFATRDLCAAENVLRGANSKSSPYAGGAVRGMIETHPERKKVTLALCRTILDAQGENGLRGLLSEADYHYLRSKIRWSPKPFDPDQ